MREMDLEALIDWAYQGYLQEIMANTFDSTPLPILVFTEWASADEKKESGS